MTTKNLHKHVEQKWYQKLNSHNRATLKSHLRVKFQRNPHDYKIMLLTNNSYANRSKN